MAFESGQRDLHAQLELRVRAGQEGPQGQGQRRGLAAAAVRGRRQGRRAGRQRPGRERLHRQPGGLAPWLDFWTSEETLQRDAAKYSLPPTMPQLYDDAAVVKTLPVRQGAAHGGRERDLAPGLARLLADLAGRVHERQQGDRRPDEPRGRAQAGPGADREGALELLMAPVELLIAGGGSRGATFAGWAARHPRARPGRRGGRAARGPPRGARRRPRRLPGPALRGLARGGAGGGRVADAAIVATLDREHTEPAIALAEQGYALLIEKPLATTEAECVAIAEATRARRRGRRGRPRAALHALHAARAAAARRGRGRRGGQRRAPRARRLLAPRPLLRARQLAPRGRGRADAARQVLPRPRLALARDRAPLRVAVSSFGSLSQLRPEQRPAGRRRPLPGLRDRARLRVLGPQDLPRAGRARRRRAGRSTSSPGRRRPSTSRRRCATAPTAAASGPATTTSSTTRSSRWPTRAGRPRA